MKHVSALVLKALLDGTIIYLVLPRYGVTSPSLIWTTVATFVSAAYVVGDLVILPATNGVITAIVDGALAAAAIWLVDSHGGHLLLPTIGLVTASVAIVAGEYLFHLYLIRTETVRLRLVTGPRKGPEHPDRSD